MLALRQGIVSGVGTPTVRMQELEVIVEGETRPAINDVALLGTAAENDLVIVNVAALDLGLDSGGFDVVHVNLTRGLGGEVIDDIHVMKLNYTSMQHPVGLVENERSFQLSSDEKLLPRAPVGICLLHGQLAAIVWAFNTQVPGAKLSFVQTAGGALPGSLSRVVEDLLDRELLADHVTVGACYGGRRESMSTIGALDYGFSVASWDAVICGPGPGILGSATRYGHGAMVALESTHNAASLGCRVVIAPRYSNSDRRVRHRGYSHHTRTVLAHSLVPLEVPAWGDIVPPSIGDHKLIRTDTDLDGYIRSGLPATTMGRSAQDDPDFFRAALAAGSLLASATKQASA